MFCIGKTPKCKLGVDLGGDLLTTMHRKLILQKLHLGSGSQENSKIFLKQNPAIAAEIESIIRAKSSDLADEILEEKIDEQIEDVPEVEEKE